jgi:hypothetical protein
LAFALAGCSGYKENDLPPRDAAGDDADASDASSAAPDGGAAEAQPPSPEAGTMEAGEAGVDATPPPPSTDLYVDAQATAGGTGTLAAPFKTITAALAAAAPGMTIHVAPGTYDRMLGEAFPLKLRGVALVGSAAGVTIHGSAYYPIVSNSNGGVEPDDQYPTLVVGSEDAATLVANVTLAPETIVPTASYDGILCDRGPSPASGASNTRVDHGKRRRRQDQRLRRRGLGDYRHRRLGLG